MLFLYILMITARRYLPNSPKYDTAKFVRLAGKIVNLLNAQWDAKIKDVDHFEIFQQPKDVKVTRDFAIGKCQILPLANVSFRSRLPRYMLGTSLSRTPRM